MSGMIKPVKKYGNSGGIYVPSSWIGGKVKVELVEEPLDIKRDILSRLDLEHVISVILYGSYARGEHSGSSDIDLIVVVDDDAEMEIPQSLGQRYDIQVKKLNEIKKSVETDAVFHKVLKDEGIALVNHMLLEDLIKNTPDLRSLEFRISLAESALNIIREMQKEGADKKDLVYPLVLRLKEIILIECITENKKYSTGLVRKEALAGGISKKDFSLLMETYRAVRDNKKVSEYMPSEDTINKLSLMLEEKIKHVRGKKGKKRH